MSHQKEKPSSNHQYSISGVYWCVAYNLIGHQSVRFQIESDESINCETTSAQTSATPHEHSSTKIGQSTSYPTGNDQSYTTNSYVTDRNEHLNNPQSTQTVHPDSLTVSSYDLNTSDDTTTTSLAVNRIQTTESGTVSQPTGSQESHSTTPHNLTTQNGSSGTDETTRYNNGVNDSFSVPTHFSTDEINETNITRTPTVFADAESGGDADGTIKVATLSFVGVTLALLLIVVVARILYWHCHSPNTHKAQTTVVNNGVVDTVNTKL